VNAFGYGRPEIVNALKAQADKVWHLSNLYQIPGQDELAKRYVRDTFAEVAFWTNSGTEAMECALKLARKYHHANGAPERIDILSFEGAFHGRSYAAVNATGKYLEGFGPLLPGYVTNLPFGDLGAVKAKIGPTTAAILIEPIQGEGGCRPASDEFLRGLRKLCDEHSLLLIYDEVQCGFGRSGKLFAHQWVDGAEPDVMCVAKGVGAGFPLGGCLATREAAKGMVFGAHGSTYGGNPLAMAVGVAAFDLMTSPGFIEEINRTAATLTQGLASLADRHADIVDEVRGKGLLRGLKLKIAPKGVQTEARARKLLVGTAGENVVRLAPPLIIGDEQVREAMAVLDDTLAAVKSERAA
jgi:acetylornithine/N-succinyldiaminopimelate aminotransferase